MRKRYFSPDAPLVADCELTARAPLSQVKWQILNSAGETAASGEPPDRLRQGEKLHLSETSSWKSTAGETYTLRVTAGGMTEEEPLFAFRRENPFLTETQEAPQEILRILPDPDLGDSRFASIGETVRKRCDGKRAKNAATVSPSGCASPRLPRSIFWNSITRMTQSVPAT